MFKRLTAFFLFFNCAVSIAQTVKTDVLVIGGSPAGISAAVQCGRSKVKTILVEQGDKLCPQLSSKTMLSSFADANWPGGFWAEFRKHVAAHYKDQPKYDTAYNSPLHVEGDVAAGILNNIADTVKNLTIQLNTSFIKIVKDDDRWEVSLLNNGIKETVKARVVVDATADGNIMKAAGGKWFSGMESINYRDNLYRTAISIGNKAPAFRQDSGAFHAPVYASYFIPVRSLAAKGVDNILVAGLQWTEPDEATAANYLRADLALGQGIGATAAFCAFFKTTTTNLKVRLIQGELLDFRGDIIPINDLGGDHYWRAIQQICATGLLKTVTKHIAGRFGEFFVPDSIVTTAEIKPVMLETYSRAFIWFNQEKPGAQFTVGNLLSFISEITLTDADNLQKSMSKAWTEQYQFTTDFDPDKPITRREFAILANRYLNPFARTVDLDGRLVN